MHRARFFDVLLLWILLVLPAVSCSRRAPRRPSDRWITLAPSMTEVLYAVGAGKELAGVCAPADYPPAAASIPVVASWEKVDIEAIVSSGASACFTVNGMQSPETLNTLRRLGLRVHSFPMENLSDLYSGILKVGALTGHPGQSRRVVERMRREILHMQNAHQGKSIPAVVVVGLDPLVAAGRGSFLNDALSVVGLENKLAGKGAAYPAVSLEDLAVAGPKVVILSDDGIPKSRQRAFIERLNGLLKKPAVLISVPGDWLARPGPRIVMALQGLSSALRVRGKTLVDAAGPCRQSEGGKS
ncbi:MAG: helical backbone metal receptor [Acidobacteriota bacterium]